MLRAPTVESDRTQLNGFRIRFLNTYHMQGEACMFRHACGELYTQNFTTAACVHRSSLFDGGFDLQSYSKIFAPNIEKHVEQCARTMRSTKVTSMLGLKTTCLHCSHVKPCTQHSYRTHNHTSSFSSFYDHIDRQLSTI
jgi:hypothetical protein